MKRIKFPKFENLKTYKIGLLNIMILIFKNNEHNTHFWRVTKAETFEEAEIIEKF